MLCECLDGRCLAKEAIESTQAVPLSGADSELTLLMLSTWTELACRLGRPSEAQALLHQIRTLITDETHPVVLAYARRAEAILADTTGDKRRRETTMREILPLLHAHSPRRKFYIWELGIFLAQQGRASELRAEMKELAWQCNERFPLSRVKMIQFIDAVETGHIQIASQLMPELSACTDDERRNSFPRYAEYQVLLGLVHAAVGDTLTGKRRAYHLPRRPVWAQIVYYLLIQDTAQALKLARMEARRQLGSLLDSGFGSLNLVRAELSSRNHDAARRLITMRRTRGNIHYLDDFFLARAELLAGNPKPAAEHFATALARADTYDARKRIDFELMLSGDLSQGDIVELTRRATSIQKRKRTPLSKATPSESPLPPADARQRATPNLQKQGVASIMGRSDPIRKVREEVLRFADLETPVLITGETGTGKELVARALHYESKRSSHTFTAINCGTISETLLESELFGHKKGAFTGADRANRGLFEETGKGTILLDEIGEVSPRMQMALLRVMETGEIRAIGSSKTRRIECRVVAATNTDLSVAAAEGSFRRDLMFRLQRLGIEMPPLRERKGDIMLLARHFLDAGRPIGTHCSLSRGLVEELREYDWPGNIRELRNVIERMRLMHSDKLTYAEDDLDIKMRTPRGRVAPTSLPPHPAGRTHPADIPKEAPTRNDPIAELLRGGNSPLRRLERLRELFTQYGELTRAEAIRIMGFSPNTATKYLKQLTDEGFIKRVEPSASTRTHYFARVDSAIKRPVLRPSPDKPM